MFPVAPSWMTWKYTWTVSGPEKNGDTPPLGVGRSYSFVTRSRTLPLPAFSAATGS